MQGELSPGNVDNVFQGNVGGCRVTDQRQVSVAVDFENVVETWVSTKRSQIDTVLDENAADLCRPAVAGVVYYALLDFGSGVYAVTQRAELRGAKIVQQCSFE